MPAKRSGQPGGDSLRAVTVKAVRYSVRIERGTLGCATARTVLRGFIATAVSPKGWACFRGHGTQKWAAACARNRAIVRAYVRSEI